MIKDGFIKKYTRASEGCNATFDDGRVVTDAILSDENSTKEELDGDWKFEDL